MNPVIHNGVPSHIHLGSPPFLAGRILLISKHKNLQGLVPLEVFSQSNGLEEKAVSL